MLTPKGRLALSTRFQNFGVIVTLSLALLAFLLTAMASTLLTQLHELSTAEEDDMQWSFFQLDTEFANLDAALAHQLALQSLTERQLRLRMDIALSRLKIVESGRPALLLQEDPQSPELIAEVDQFFDEAVAILDRGDALTATDVDILHDLVEEVRPAIRKLALIGVSVGANRSEARRADFSSQLRLTGGTAIVMILFLSLLILQLARMRTREKQKEIALQESRDRLASSVHASLDAIIISDGAGRIVDFNEAAEEVFGWTFDEVVDRKMVNLIIPAKHREAHRKGMKRFIATRRPRVLDAGRVELTALRKSGEEFPIELNITSVDRQDGIEFIAYLRDISERKINEQKLIDARDRAERTDRAKSQFMAVMSHEMRTPLNGILGVLDLLKTTELSPHQARYTDIATASSEILLEHINEALDITRIETGAVVLNEQNFSLVEMVGSAVDVLDPLAQEKGLQLSYSVDDHMDVPMFGDASRIRQILTNLVGNAIKFTDQGSVKVVVGGIHSPGQSSLSIQVTDTGPGIDDEHQEQIFEDFVALAHGEGRQSRSDGLGLSISRRIARLMGGDLTVSSKLGEGTTFKLMVPIQRSKDPVDENANADDSDGAAVPAQEILVVEDNQINRRILREMLEGMGHNVVTANDGLKGLQQAQAKPFDLIFMDVSMPEMNGIEATRRLRATDGPNQDVRIVGLTAHGHEEYRARALDAGMSQFFTKPLRLPVLNEILSETANMPAQETSEPAIPFELANLSELCEVLGVERVKTTCQQFFLEVTALLGDPNADAPVIKAAAHKSKGAAALLGMRSLETLLANLEQAAADQDPVQIEQCFELLNVETPRVQDDLDIFLERLDS